jgi:chloride channel 6
LRTLFVKIFGLGLAVSSGLCIGKEGPLAHIGAIMGHCVVYLPIKIFDYFRNDLDKRELAAAGAAAGVAAAFGSPIGGSLFAYEISRPSTFWSFGLMWKTLLISTYDIRQPSLPWSHSKTLWAFPRRSSGSPECFHL